MAGKASFCANCSAPPRRFSAAVAAAIRRPPSTAADTDAASWAASMENAYFTGFDHEEHLAHAALARRAAAEGGAAAQGRIRQDRNAAEITVTAHDRRGLFANLAAA